MSSSRLIFLIGKKDWPSLVLYVLQLAFMEMQRSKEAAAGTRMRRDVAELRLCHETLPCLKRRDGSLLVWWEYN